MPELTTYNMSLYSPKYWYLLGVIIHVPCRDLVLNEKMLAVSDDKVKEI